MTIYYSHAACLDHDMGEGHPESPARLAALQSAFEAIEFNQLDRREPPEATLEQVELMHPGDYVENILASVPISGMTQIDPDTRLCPGSGQAVLRAAGAACAAVDAVAYGEAKNAFCSVRPPGHHAEKRTAMGFCFFNNIAIAAGYARARHGIERIAVIDFDVHHGNGTQQMFWSEANFFFASTHQMPLYPGTGAKDERGDFDNILNVPLESGAGSDQFRAAITENILPSIYAFRPELLLVSAGFDAHERDPLAGLNLLDEDYAWVTQELMGVAEHLTEGRIVSMLEGGYDLNALVSSASAHVRELMKA